MLNEYWWISAWCLLEIKSILIDVFQWTHLPQDNEWVQRPIPFEPYNIINNNNPSNVREIAEKWKRAIKVGAFSQFDATREMKSNDDDRVGGCSETKITIIYYAVHNVYAVLMWYDSGNFGRSKYFSTVWFIAFALRLILSRRSIICFDLRQQTKIDIKYVWHSSPLLYKLWRF